MRDENEKYTEQELLWAAATYLTEVGRQFADMNFAVTGHSLGGNLAFVSANRMVG